jgi:hypothetical protein
MATCVPCSAGTYSSEQGVGLCLDCAAGTYSNTTGVSACLLCGIGKYAFAPGVRFCLDCTNGKYSASEGRSNCTDCAAGKYSNDTGRSVCQLCPARKYSTTLGASSDTTCVPCSKDSDSTAGSANITECLCNPGYSGADGGPCHACTVGAYKPGKGSACFLCEAGKYVDFLLLCRVSRVLHTLNQRRAAATSHSVCAMLATWVVMREVASPASRVSMEAIMARVLSVTQASTLRRERQSAPSAGRARGPGGGLVHAMIPRLPANLAPSVRLIHLCVHFVKLESLEHTRLRASVFANIARLENIKTRREKLIA